MKKTIRVTLNPSASAQIGEGGDFRIVRIDNAAHFDMPGSWALVGARKGIGSSLSSQEVEVLLNNPDFEVSCVEEHIRCHGGEFGIRDAVDRLHASVVTLGARVESAIGWLAVLVVAAAVIGYFWRRS